MGSHPRALWCLELFVQPWRPPSPRASQKGIHIMCTGIDFFSRSVTCIIMVVKASQISVISDGLWCGKTQVVEKVSQQVDTLGELGAHTSSWLEMSFISPKSCFLMPSCPF